MKTKKITLISILIAQSLVLYLIERSIPVPFIAPGAKLGLSNIVTVSSLYILNFSSAVLILILRIVLSSFLGGSLSSLLYSLFGGIFSILTMYLLKKFGSDDISPIGVSIGGGFSHNLGQIIAASLIIQNVNIFFYLPILAVSGIITGFFVGITSNMLINAFTKLNIYNN